MPDSASGSSTEPTTGRRVTPGVAAAGVAASVLLVVGVVALVLGLRGSATAPPPQPAAGAVVATSTPPAGSTSASGSSGSTRSSASPGQGGTPTPGGRSAAGSTGRGDGIGTFLEASQPTSIEIPSIGMRSKDFVSLHVQRDGTISVPGTAQEVGLYDAGPTPGQLGPSVIAAHVDTPSGVPGIFYRLGQVKAGDVVRITRQDGSRLTFTVDRVTAFRKSGFPTALVYKGDFTRPEIRLVTCGGPTDDRNEYRDNVVVFGHLSSAA